MRPSVKIYERILQQRNCQGISCYDCCRGPCEFRNRDGTNPASGVGSDLFLRMKKELQTLKGDQTDCEMESTTSHQVLKQIAEAGNCDHILGCRGCFGTTKCIFKELDGHVPTTSDGGLGPQSREWLLQRGFTVKSFERDSLTLEPLRVGDEVVRGPDWEWRDQDSNSVGVVRRIQSDGWVNVQWNLGRGNINCYRYYFREGKRVQDLRKVESKKSEESSVKTSSASTNTYTIHLGSVSSLLEERDDLVDRLLQ